MNPQEQLCHCIISHPSKAKFLVIKHSDRWSPPMIRLPAAGPMALKAKLITDTLRDAYGLRATALRQWLSTPGYHCVELELQSEAVTRPLKAVWVGREEYGKYRSTAASRPDPFEAWLEHRASGDMTPLRPWEQPGWLQRASDWMLHELDRHGVQVTGSVEQHTAFRHSSSVLRVPTAVGFHYLKAGLAQSPQEARLLPALAGRWPDWVPAPLAVNAAENWTLSADYRAGAQALEFTDYPAIGAGLAALQVASASSLDEWQALGCAEAGPGALQHFVENLVELDEVLGQGGGIALDAKSIGRLHARAADWQSRCLALAEVGLPDTLVHPDLWYANLQRRPGGYWITDWSGAAVGQPFLGVLKLLRYRALWQENQPVLPAADGGPDSMAEEIVARYLQPFTGFAAEARLREGLAQARALEGPWRLLKWKRDLDFEVPDSFGYQRVARKLQQIARELTD